MKYRPIVKTVEAYQYTGHNAEEFVERFGVLEFDDGTLGLKREREVTLLLCPTEWVLVEPGKRPIIVPDYVFKSRYEPAE